MHNNPLVTVICLCYNHAEFVVEALESVLLQTYPNVELIIADDFSTDNSVEVIQKWLVQHPEVPFFTNTENLGNTKTFNRCLKIAKGDYIIDLAADDVLLKDCIENQLRGFAASKHENLAIVYGNAELITSDGKFMHDYFPTDDNRKGIEIQPTGDIYSSILNGKTKLCSISALTKKNVFEKLNGYDENLAYEDLDFWIRAARNYNFDYIDEILIKKRVLPDSMYTYLTKKNNARTRRFNYSTYLILKKVYTLNRYREDFQAMLKRIYIEMHLAYITRDFRLFVNYIFLGLKVWLKILTW